MSELYVRFKQKKGLLSTMAAAQAAEMSEAWPDTFDEGYIHQFQPEPTRTTHEQQQKHWV